MSRRYLKPKRTLPSTVSQGKDEYDWNTMPIAVVLPQPDGPTNTTNSPSAMLSESGSTTSIRPPRGSPNHFVTSWNSMKPAFIGMACQRSAEITERAAMARADELIRDQADDADGQNAGEDLRRLAVPAGGPEPLAHAPVRGDDLG